ncbi:MAG TPA: GNAT family N-acetyltransferase [Pyrinomonadaceae bacterium]|nr:GNAT family N-acetyltransferase [Pyrinomonadaceae bacterium]
MHDARSLFQSLKTNSTPNRPCLSIPVGFPVEAFMRPVSTLAGKLNDNDVRVLTEWRNRFVHSFLSEFEATDARTASWLTEIIGPDPTKIMFMLDDLSGQTIGYLGLGFIDWETCEGEADAAVRGVPAAPGIMSRAFLTLLGWAYEQLGLKIIRGRVRSDNPSLRFFLKLATETKRVPLRRIEEPGMIRWVEDETLTSSSLSLVHLVFDRELSLAASARARASQYQS